MAQKARGRSDGKAKISANMVPLNPWIPAVPVRTIKGKVMLKLVLGIPLVFAAGTVAGEPLPNRTLQVPVELTRQGLSLREFDRSVRPFIQGLLEKYEARIILVQKGS